MTSTVETGPLCVIIEGMDRAGKTTLIERFKHLRTGPWVTIHNGRQPDHRPTVPLAQYLWQCRLMAHNPDHWYIIDRMHLSELVYSRMYRTPNEAIMAVEDHLPPHTFLVLVERDIDDVMGDDDGQNTVSEYGDGSRRGYIQEQERFRSAVAASRFPYIAVDPAKRPFQALSAVQAGFGLLRQEAGL